MVDFNDIIVSRVIIHTINAKVDNQDHATVDYSNEVLAIDDTVLEIIKERLINAAGKNSKAFELELENTSNGSFFVLSNGIESLSEEEFIIKTSEIADHLAEQQKRTTIPGGFLIIMDCQDSETNTAIQIVIKAEPHEALQFEIIDGHSKVNLLKKVFLSPSQKLFKIGIKYTKAIDIDLPISEQFGCFLYDEQFRIDSTPAEYFYKDFLGFSIGKNSKIQSQRFYEKTEKFIHAKFIELDEKSKLLTILKNEFSHNLEPTISPIEFANSYLPIENRIRDTFIAEVCSELPLAIAKDLVLLKNKLFKRKMGFPKDVNISGPEANFDEKVTIIQNREELEELSIDSNLYTIVKIAGKPYSAGE